MAHNLSEAAIAPEKHKTFLSFAKEIAEVDFDSVKNSLSAISDLHVHLKHRLLSHDGLEARQKRPKRIEASLGNIPESIDSKEQNEPNSKHRDQ